MSDFLKDFRGACMKRLFKRIFAILITSLFLQQFLQQETRACDVAVITASASATGRPFIWKNRDHTDSYRHHLLYVSAVNPNVGGSLRLMGETVIDTTSDPSTTCSGGSNESGFAIANTTVYDSHDQYDINNINTNLVEKALEQCRTLAEFETIARNYTTYWTNKTISGNFAVIDAYGGAAIYEMWTEDGRGETLKFRKFDANTGAVTDQDGAAAADNKYSSIEHVGFNNRTNSFHTNGWREITSDTPRELRAGQLFSAMKLKDELSPVNVMRYVSKDVCGDNPGSRNIYDPENLSEPEDYFYDPGVYVTDGTKTIISNIWDSSNDDNDFYYDPNYDGEMFTAYCISRYQTTMGLVIEGAANPDQASLTTMWISLGEPSLSVFIPFFPFAHKVSAYAADNAHTNTGYYWDGVSTTSNTKPTCFLNLLFDCAEANPFTGSYYPELIDVYTNVSLYKNNGSGSIDYGYRTYGSTYVMDTTINYPRLLSLQAWTFPLEDLVFNGAERYLSVLRANPSLITRERLAEFSGYCCKFVYENYCTNIERMSNSQSSSFTVWSYELPDDGLYPAVVSISPAYGASGLSGIVPVTVVFSEPVDQATINQNTFRLMNGPASVAGSFDISSSTVTFTPDGALVNNSTYTVQLTAGIKDLSGKSMEADYNTSFTTRDDIDPFVSSISPAYGDADKPVDTAISVVFSEPVDASTVNENNFTLMNGTAVISGTVTYDALLHTALFTPAAALDNSVTYTVVLNTGIRDLAGNSLVYCTSTFTTVAPADVIAPAVSSIYPAYGGINPPVDTAISVEFSEPLDEATINDGTFTLMNGTAVISGTVTYDALLRTAAFTPASVLDSNTAYTVILTDGIRDLAGNSLVYYTSTFTTTASADVTDPAVSTIYPVNGVSDIPVSTTISVLFSEPVDSATINTDTFRLMNGTTAIGGTVTYNSSSLTAVFTPSGKLAYSTTYTVELASGIKDLSGNSLADYISTFTTEAVSDVVPPSVISVDPANGVVNPPVTSTITVKFSEPVDASTVNENNFMLMNGTVIIPGIVKYDSLLRTASFNPGGTLGDNTIYTVKLTTGIKDLSGNSLASGYNSVFTVLSTGTSPFIKAVNTGNGGAIFPVDGYITVEFSEPVDPDSINAGTFIVLDENGAVAGTVCYDSSTNTAIFMPDNQLNYYTTYTVRLTTGITTETGVSLADDITWIFTTNPDGIVPAITYVNPGDKAVQSPVSGTISVKFNKIMNSDTINKNSFRVSSVYSSINGSVRYNPLSSTAYFTPDAMLDYNTAYTVEVTADMEDIQGISIEDTKWTFTTESDIITASGDSSGSEGSGCGCGSAAEAAAPGSGSRPLLPGLVSLLGTMLFPLSLIWMHRKKFFESVIIKRG